MDKYIKRPPYYEHLAPVFQTLPCDTCHRHLAGSFRASCSGFCKVKSSYQKMCGMSKKFYRGNSWQNSWRNTRRGNSHRKSPEKSPEEFTETYRTEGGGIIGRFTVKVVPIPGLADDSESDLCGGVRFFPPP